MDQYNICILSFAKIKILYKITLPKFMYVVKNVDVNLVTLPLWFLLGVKVWNDKMDFNPIAGTCVFNVFSYFRLWHLLRSVEIKKDPLLFYYRDSIGR